ncbi:MAG: 30S ribosomal protein S8 [Chloroflexota bacterium]|nr:MAG: 30S ribosomal protein S8 [Chloroflexota bacterium]
MATSDPLADMFTRIRNAAAARHDDVRIPASNVKRAVAEVLRQEGFVKNVMVSDEGARTILKVDLTYGDDRRALLTGIRRVSRPGLRVYVNQREIPRVFGGLGVAIMSTSQGVMSGREAWRRKIGGEVLCYVW